MLFAVMEIDGDVVFTMEILCQMLCTVDTAMLSPSTSESKHERSKTSFNVSLHMGVCQLIDMRKERRHFTVVFNEPDDGCIQPSHLFILLVSSGIMASPTVEDIASTVA